VGAAATAFDQRYGELMARAVSRVDPSRAAIDDALQTLREKLFVGVDGGPPQILGYAGRGPLGGWLASAAVRTALKRGRRRDARTHATLDSGTPALASAPSPELQAVRNKYRACFEEAVRAAAARLGARDRALLKLHLAEKMSIDRLAALYHVGRSTAA